MDEAEKPVPVLTPLGGAGCIDEGESSGECLASVPMSEAMVSGTSGPEPLVGRASEPPLSNTHERAQSRRLGRMPSDAVHVQHMPSDIVPPLSATLGALIGGLKLEPQASEAAIEAARVWCDELGFDDAAELIEVP